LLTRSALERSDFVFWPGCEVLVALQVVGWSG
jgi:hypothetical protein